MADFDNIVFGKKKLSDLFKEVYERNVSKERVISDAIEQLKALISTSSDALIVVPLIASYMDLHNKNDDILIKMLAIVQKGLDRGKDTGNYTITDEEKEQLLQLANEKYVEKQLLVNNNLPKA